MSVWEAPEAIAEAVDVGTASDAYELDDFADSFAVFGVASFNASIPFHAEIQGSWDGTTWFTVQTIANVPSGVNTLVSTPMVPVNSPAKYLRVNSSAANSGTVSAYVARQVA